MKCHRVKSLASRWFVVESFIAHYQHWRKMINVTEEDDGSFTITWDENDPQESVLNTWTQEDFTEHIRSYCEKIIAESDDPDNASFAIEDALQEAIDEQKAPVARQDDEDERLPRLFF